MQPPVAVFQGLPATSESNHARFVPIKAGSLSLTTNLILIFYTRESTLAMDLFAYGPVMRVQSSDLIELTSVQSSDTLPESESEFGIAAGR